MGAPKVPCYKDRSKNLLWLLPCWVEVGIPGWPEATECVHPFPLHPGAHCSGPAGAVPSITRAVVVLLG